MPYFLLARDALFATSLGPATLPALDPGRARVFAQLCAGKRARQPRDGRDGQPHGQPHVQPIFGRATKGGRQKGRSFDVCLTCFFALLRDIARLELAKQLCPPFVNPPFSQSLAGQELKRACNQRVPQYGDASICNRPRSAVCGLPLRAAGVPLGSPGGARLALFYPNLRWQGTYGTQDEHALY